MTNSYLQIHKGDNLVVALTSLKKGSLIEEWQLKIQEDIPPKQKFTTRDIQRGEALVMYGVRVGHATSDISRGSKITVDNIAHSTSPYIYKNIVPEWSSPKLGSWPEKTFMGYRRSSGKVGTMNYWLVVPLVFCENRNTELIQDFMLDRLGYTKGHPYDLDMDQLISIYERGGNPEEIRNTKVLFTRRYRGEKRPFQNIDGIKFLTHEGGCGGSRQDSHTLCKLIAGYVAHPNVAGATILSLGCQNAQVELLKKELEYVYPDLEKQVLYFEHQQAVSETEYLENIVKETFIGLMNANHCEREAFPLDKLCIGLECGGSDGFSGISANPTLGHLSDLIVGLGGSAILSEFPELHGVEQELIDRCLTEKTARKFIELMRAYSMRAKADGTDFSMNPSPGNIRDGLITDAIKSAGAAKKGGTSPITDVLDYTEPQLKAGLNLLCTPGNDVESTTGLAGSGANVILFTSGLGTPTGNPVVPVLKVSSNTILAQRMPDIIDFNTGDIINGHSSIRAEGEKLLDLVVRTASGDYTPKAVLNGQDDFIPWKRGISL